MRNVSVIAILIASLIAGCAGQKDRSFRSPIAPGTNGYTNAKGTPYTNGGDSRVTTAVEQDDASSASADLPTPVKMAKQLRERLIAFSLVRTDKDSDKAKRFGKDQFKISIFVRKDDGGYTELKFAGDFLGTSTERVLGPISPVNDPQFSLTGKLTDLEDKVKGEFSITNSKTGETGQVFYRAYKAKITVRENQTPEAEVANKKFANSIDQLKTDTFAWVNNWVTVKGPSFYSVDILRIVHDSSRNPDLKTLLSMSGEALQTGEEADPEHAAQVAKNSNSISAVTLVGDAGDAGNRMFEVTMEDSKSKDKAQVMVEVEEVNPEPQPEQKIEDTTDTAVDENVSAEDQGSPISPTLPLAPTSSPNPKQRPEKGPQVSTEAPTQPMNPSTNESAPVHKTATKPAEEIPTAEIPVEDVPAEQAPVEVATPARPQQKAPAGLRGVTENSFLYYNMSSPQVAKMVRDYDANWELKSVQTWIRNYSQASGWKKQMASFLYNAKPFRSMIEAIGNAYDNPPSYVFLTMMESRYFKDGKYHPAEQNPGSSATGIFQVITGTARTLGLRVDKSVDERKYFASSACGAARYISQITDGLNGKDATLAILGYNQGEGGLANRMGTANRLIDNYSYTFREMAKFKAGITNAQIQYVSQFIATYFITGNPGDYGFSDEGRSSLPDNGSVFPPGGIKSAVCTEAMSQLDIPRS